MIEHIQQYYLSERSGGIIGALAGIVFVAAAILLWRYTNIMSVGRGLAYSLLGMGLLFVMAAGANAIYNQGKLARLPELRTHTETELHRAETERMDKVMATSYIAGLSIFSIALVLGLGLVFVTSSPLVKGIALGLLLFGCVGHMVEAFSMERNGAYRDKLKQTDTSPIAIGR